MTQSLRDYSNGYVQERGFDESPFLDTRRAETAGEAGGETETASEMENGLWHLESPFVAGEAAQSEAAATPEIAGLAEIAAELKDSEFRDSLEELANEALEANAGELSGEYGDRETRDSHAERLLNEHFRPLNVQADAVLERFFEHLEGAETESVTEGELDRIASEVLASEQPRSPAAEQFLGGLVRKVKKLASGAVTLAKRGIEGAAKLAGKGLSALGKLALGPLLAPLKLLAKFLLRHVVRFALGHLPPALQPIARRLSDKLLQAMGETAQNEIEDHEQTENEVVPAGADVARLEHEFDVQAAQLLLSPEGAETEQLVESYGESGARGPLADLDAAREQFARELNALTPEARIQPMMEQFAPALLWPAAKTAITLLGRPKLVNFLGGLLGKLIRPMVGANVTNLLAPSIADAGLRIFGLEASEQEAAQNPRAAATEALAATVEETVNAVAELPPHVFENDTLFECAVREAFETAASTYFPGALIKPELRETEDGNGRWQRAPTHSHRKRYTRYTESVPVTITPRVAAGVTTFGGATLNDHLRDRMDVPAGRPLKTRMRLYQVLPGTTAAAIARAEGFRAQDLHPLTAQAAGALLGPASALGGHLGAGAAVTTTPASYLATPHRLHVRQRLYYLEPPNGRHRRPHVRLSRSEMQLDLRSGEIHVWLYLSEKLCQLVAAELARPGNASGAFRLMQPLLRRPADMLQAVLHKRHLPSSLRILGEAPNLENEVRPWLEHASRSMSAKLTGWVSQQVAQFLRNHSDEFRKATASHHDGVTLRITMTRVPGLETLRAAASGGPHRVPSGNGWLAGTPSFGVTVEPGYGIH